MAPTITINATSLFLFLGACQSLLFIFLLAFKSKGMWHINQHIALLLLAIGVEVSHEFLLQTQLIHLMPWLVGFSLPFDALVATSLYWYVRLITRPESCYKTHSIVRRHWIFFTCVVLSVPAWLMPFTDTLSMMQTGVIPEHWPAWAYWLTLLQIPLKIVSFIVYLIAAIRLLLAHRRRIDQFFSNHERITLNWLTWLLALFVFGLINGVLMLTVFQQYSEQTQVMGFLGGFSLLAIFYLGIMGVMQPQIYSHQDQSGLNHLDALSHKTTPANSAALETEDTSSNHSTETNLSTEANQGSKEKYQNSALALADMQRIAAKLEQAMASERLFLDANLTLPTLAGQIGVSANYLSQTINSQFEMNFYDYINGLRVEFAKQLLTSNQHAHLSVLDVSVEAGFNARSSFYSAFKQNTQMTPAQFRKHASQASPS